MLTPLQDDSKDKSKGGIEVLYIQMEYCEGSNLKQYIKSVADMPNPETKK